MTPRAERSQQLTKIFKTLEKISIKLRVYSDRLFVCGGGGSPGADGEGGGGQQCGGGGAIFGGSTVGGCLPSTSKNRPSHHNYVSKTV